MFFQRTRTKPSWQDQLGPFGRGRPAVALFTLVVFTSTTLSSSLAWAQDGAKDEGPKSLGPLAREELSVALEDGQRANDLAPAAKHARTASAAPALRGAQAAKPVGIEASETSAPTNTDRAFAALPKASAPVAAQAISMPSGAATIDGMGESFSAQLTTGVATFEVPFTFPTARGAAQPLLGLSYASSSGSGDAGMGWSLVGGVFIARQTDRGTPGYDDRTDFHSNQDRFVFGADELVPICTVSASGCSGAPPDEVFPEWAEGYQYFRTRIEGSFQRFFWSPDHRTWRVQSKDGLHLELGAATDGSDDANAIEANLARPNEVFRWHLARQYDSRGEPEALPVPLPTNVVRYRYLADGGLRHLSDIFYTPPTAAPRTTDSAEFAHHVHIAWQPRPDSTSSYRGGFLQQHRLRLERVDVSSKPFVSVNSPRELVRRYHASYAGGLHTSLLAQVQAEGRCQTAVTENAAGLLPSTSCPRLPALRLGYQHVTGAVTDSAVDEDGLAFEPFNRSIRSLDQLSPPHSLDEQLVALMDVDSDSLPDLVSTAPGLYQGKHGLFLNGRGGDFGFGAALGMSVTGVSNVDEAVLSLGNSNVAPLDPDGDATLDLLHMPGVKRYSIFTPQKQGSSFAWVGRSISTAQDQDPKIDFTREAARIARVDVNADGLVDLVFSSATELQTFFALGRFPGGDTQFGHGEWTSASSAALSTEPVRTCLPWSAQPIRFDDPELRFGDMNGDGLSDIVRLRPGQLLYWPGRGNGFWGTGDRDDCKAGSFGQDRHIAVANAPRFGTAINGGLELGDVSGDGLPDLVEFRADAVDIYLNENGERFTDRRTLSDVPFKPSTSRYVQITDLDGSTTPDLVWGRAHEFRFIDLTGGVRPHLLTRVENGMGKVTALEYASSTELMLAARKSAEPWKRALPMAVPVVVRVTQLDQLEKVGRPGGSYVTEYEYRDPLFDGRQREFRGFEAAATRVLGDENSPSVTTHSTFLLGDCQIAGSGVDVCSYADRWQDNWREALKGQPSLIEAVDEHGVYQSTTHNKYELRQLYAGRDGRRVVVAYPVGQEAFVYDTAGFTPADTTIELHAIAVNLDGISQNEARPVLRRATTGTVRIRSSASFDDFGHALTRTAEGCVEGCGVLDEVITHHAEHTRLADDSSGWMFRATRTFVSGSVHTEPRLLTRNEYDAAGDVERSFSTLSGTLPLDRFHATGADIAPAPANASAGSTSPVEVQTMEYTRDDFGSIVAQRSPLSRCRSIAYDSVYAELPISETIYAGEPDALTGCGERELTTSATFDRGMGLLLTTRDVAQQPARFDYDGFGRLTARFYADTEVPGELAALPSTTYEYLLPENPNETPYTILITHEQNGELLSDASYLDSYTYMDGLGRTLVALLEADPLNGDDGDFVAGNVRTFDGKGALQATHEPFFWTGEPLEFDLALPPPSSFTSQQWDAFGRPIASFGLDGQIKAFRRYGAFNEDVFDAFDIEPGPRHGTHSTVIRDGHGRGIKSIERIRTGTPPVLEERQQLIEHLPTGEPIRITNRRAGSPDLVRWLRYDSQGRMVLNVEPNTSVGFTPDLTADASTFKALRYAYNDLGEVVGTSDARGCGANYFYDAAGRIVAEDYSPCEAAHAPYSEPDVNARTGIETLYHYDTADTSLGEIVDAAGVALAPAGAFYAGQVVSVAARGSFGVLRYDARGRMTGGALRVARPGIPSDSLDDRYAPRWYLSQTKLDALSRSLESSTGVTTPELLGADSKSLVTAKYSERGVPIETGSSYGTLVTETKVAADGRLLSLTLGDAAETQRAFSYDSLRRLKTVQTYRAGPELWTSVGYPAPSTEPTQQLSLEDTELTYDAVDNITAITDYRIPEEWPASAKPVSKSYDYDDLYRVLRATSTYPTGGDTWTSPHDAENEGRSDGPKPSPHVAFDQRANEQRYAFDHLGNLTQTTDDASGFFDRSLGAQQHGTPGAGPHQLLAASNRGSAPTSLRKGNLEARYDDAGNLNDMLVVRDGPCLPQGASCSQRFHYGWDELGRLALAQRWDLTSTEAGGTLDEPPPARTADVELHNIYDAEGTRIVKTAVDVGGNQSHTVYINGSYQLRSTTWSDGDYALDSERIAVYLAGTAVQARVVYSEEDLPTLSSGQQHLFLELNDYLGSGSIVLDHETGELVELSTYLTYGSVDSDYRPGRWGEFREARKFSGKEEDVEVGLAYFGTRFLVLGLARWASPDPVTIQELRGDPNPYAYVGGRATTSIDPNGAEPISLTAVLIGAAISAAIAAGGAYYVEANAQNNANIFKWKKGWEAVGRIGIAAGIGFAAGFAGGYAGAWAGSMVGHPIAAQAASGAVGAATSWSTSHVLSYPVNRALYNTDEKFFDGEKGWSLFSATAFGAVGGLLTGLPKLAIDKAENYQFGQTRPPPATRGFATERQAVEAAGMKWHDIGQHTETEFAGYIYKDGNKFYLSKTFVGNGDQSPLVLRHIDPAHQGKVTGWWHTHPGFMSNNNFSGTPGDIHYQEVNRARQGLEKINGYLVAPSGDIKVIGGPETYGTKLPSHDGRTDGFYTGSPAGSLTQYRYVPTVMGSVLGSFYPK